ncbi:MAG: ferritin family protein [Nitrospinae bacterium]|nr:ferritin family protein [Nitrospinota bacterium]MBI3814130.1 ferritin family protein [Nitrospinota bacterium]
MNGMTVQEVLAFARILEETANKFYADEAKMAKLPNAKKFLEELAKEEMGHKELIVNLEKKIEAGGDIPKIKKKIKSLNISDFAGRDKVDDDADFIDILAVAMSREKESVKAYSTFADSLEDGKVKELFDFLINEEKRHLRRFEEDYDDYTDEMSHKKVRELIKKTRGK